MSFRRIHRRDNSQPELVKNLRDAGVDVWVIGEPCDLLLRFWCNRHRDFCWQPLEAKTPYGKKDPKARLRPEQEKQQEFLRETQTPIATDFDTAWTELNKRHALGRVEPRIDPPRAVVDNPEPRLFQPRRC